ncbi:MAG: hypothetical protein U0941_25000 [Planctomycetaceae bacterium]
MSAPNRSWFPVAISPIGTVSTPFFGQFRRTLLKLDAEHGRYKAFFRYDPNIL